MSWSCPICDGHGPHCFFAKIHNIHLPFKDLGSIRMSIGPHVDSKGFILGFVEDRCKDSKGIGGILKDLYKDSS